MFEWRRARKRARAGQIGYLERAYSLAPNDRNFGVCTAPLARRQQPLASVVCRQPMAARDSRNVLLSPAIFRVWPDWDWGLQGTGDCLISGTRVLMADGTEKPIEDVRPGECVMTHNNKPRNVLRTIKKPYRGNLVEVQLTGLADSLTMTPDHLCASYPGIPSPKLTGGEMPTNRIMRWTKAGDATEGLRLLVPHANLGHSDRVVDIAGMLADMPLQRNNGRLKLRTGNSIAEAVGIDDRMGWLIGIYLAEGGSCAGGNALRFSLAADEPHFAAKIVEYLKDCLGVAATITIPKWNPACLLVHAYCKLAAVFFKRLARGNLYGMQVPECILRSPTSVKKACLRGWMDGDGHFRAVRAYNLAGSTVSPALARGMFRLAMQCGCQAKLQMRDRKIGNAKPEWSVVLDGESALVPYPERRTAAIKTRPSKRIMTDRGMALPVRKITIHENQDTFVYCLEVEEDHSFVANGIAVHNCVGWGTAHMGDVNLAVAHLAGKIRKPDALVCQETVYAFGKCELFDSYGYHGAGMSGIDAVEGWKRFGTLYHIEYPSYDLREYSGSRAVAWGERPRATEGVPNSLEPYAAEHKARDYVQVDSLDAGVALLQAGYAWQYCGYTYWPTSRTSDGMGSRFTSGWHCMTCVGVIHDSSGNPAWLRIANTGHGDHVDGPNEPGDVPQVYQECGGWVPTRLIEPVIRAGDCYCVSFVEGWEVLDLKDLGFGGPWL